MSLLAVAKPFNDISSLYCGLCVVPPRNYVSCMEYVWLSLQPQANKFAEVARIRLKYNEAIQEVASLQQQLADVEIQISPAQNESDKDRCALSF